MRKFRNKPIVVDAFKYDIDDRPDWFSDKVTTNDIITHVGTDLRSPEDYYCEIKTPLGIMRGNVGDYIVKNEVGVVYPSTPNTFETLYEEFFTESVNPENLQLCH